MLGFRFCPRLRDFPDRRLAPIAPVTAYPSITPLLGKRIRTDIIGEQWEDVLRLVGSIKAGHVAPSVMLRKLAAYERQNQLDVALQEIGKIERTLFMLDWLENPDLRRRCHAGLNNSEQRHALTQAIYTFRQGRIIDRSHEAQQYLASGLNLLVAAIVYWNTIYMDAAAQHLRSTSVAVPDDLLAHTSPVGWEHIAFSGDSSGIEQPLPLAARPSICRRIAAPPKRSLIVRPLRCLAYHPRYALILVTLRALFQPLILRYGGPAGDDTHGSAPFATDRETPPLAQNGESLLIAPTSTSGKLQHHT